MVKKLLFLSVILCLLVVTAAFMAIAPYHIYTLTLTEGVATNFLAMKPSSPVFYDGKEIEFIKSENDNQDRALFRTFHFSHFLLPLPMNHPVFSMIPTIKTESTGPRLGASFLDGKNSLLFSYILEKPYKLETISGDQKIFLLPVFKNHISRKTDEEVWRDLFSKKLSLPSNVGKSFYQSLLTLKSVSYADLVYNLYILYNRTHLFPKDSLKISYDSATHHGLIELPSEDINFKEERLFIIDKGIVYSLTMKTKKDNSAAENFRNKMILESTYKMSSPDSAIPIYAEYKNIPYVHRIDQQGMTYLYTAWSHDLANRDFVRVIILFLERGQSNLKFLKPFYEFAYKRFGTNLSSDSNTLFENADEKLKRRMDEELEGEIKKEKGQSSHNFEGNFSTPEEKIKYNLQKAKENKINSDESNKILMQE